MIDGTEASLKNASKVLAWTWASGHAHLKTEEEEIRQMLAKVQTSQAK
jgi:hypothetical protein